MRQIMTAALVVTLAACGSQPGNDAAPAEANAAVETGAVEDAPFKPVPTEPQDEPQPAIEPADATIPAALHGRWGLVPADCEPGRSDAKGLLTIDRDSLRFYESRATLGGVAERDDTRIVADYSFTGEGQEWQRRIVLDGQDGGQILIRRDYGDDAMPGPLRYAKCAAE